MTTTLHETLTDTELAKALNVARTTAWRWRKAGMPNTSLDEAKAWAANQVNKNTKNLEDVPDPIAVSGDCAYDVLARLRVNEQVISGEIRALTLALNRARSARNASNDETEIRLQEKKIFSYTQMLKAVRKEHRESTKSLFAAETAVVSLEEQRGNLVTLEAAKDLITKRLMPLILFLKKLPDEASTLPEKVKLTEVGNRGLAIIRGEDENENRI